MNLKIEFKGFWYGVVMMAIVVTASNILVQYPINVWYTWGAFTYPIAFLITDLTNRRFGVVSARRVVYVGFIFAVILSFCFSASRIACASGLAFLLAHLLDVKIFDLIRQRVWWLPPLLSSLVASAVDTALFFSIAFAGTEVPWVTLAFGDYSVKLAMTLIMLVPYMGFINLERRFIT